MTIDQYSLTILSPLATWLLQTANRGGLFEMQRVGMLEVRNVEAFNYQWISEFDVMLDH